MTTSQIDVTAEAIRMGKAMGELGDILSAERCQQVTERVMQAVLAVPANVQPGTQTLSPTGMRAAANKLEEELAFAQAAAI